MKLGLSKRILPAMAEIMKLAAIMTRPMRAWLIFCWAISTLALSPPAVM